MGFCLAALLLTGCSGGKPSKPPNAESTAGLERVTLHVKEMTRRLKLDWLGWPNRVEQALSGLPGVRAIEVDLGEDLLEIPYDPAQTTPQTMLEVVAKQGFEGKIVPNKGTQWRRSHALAVSLRSDAIHTWGQPDRLR